MAQSLMAQYAREVWRELRLWPVWPPESRVQVGDYGLVQEGVFNRLGTLRDLELEFRRRRSNTSASELYSSRGAVECSVGAGASLQLDSVFQREGAKLRVSFSRSRAVLMALGQVALVELDRPAVLGEQVAALYRAGKWDLKWHVVVAAKESASGLIALSRSRNASLELTLEAGNSLAEALSIGAGLSVAANKSIAFHVAAYGRLTPLVALRRLHLSTATSVLRGEADNDELSTYATLAEVQPDIE